MTTVVAFVNVYESLTTNNFLFTCSNTGIGDNLLQPFIELKTAWEKIGVKACTPDTVDIKDIDLFIFWDMPDDSNIYFRFAISNKIPMYLVIDEIIYLHTENMKLDKHKYFEKIFTYMDDLVDNKKYFKFNYSFNFPDTIPNDISLKEKLCVMIASNKYLRHPLELYSKRIEAIRWFEKHHPESFDLYGFGWDKKHRFYGSALKRIFNRSGLIRKIFTKKFPSWRGSIPGKHDVLSKYKFSICYENADIIGNISEKIFDCFFARCVPVYWGARNIADHIPETCFIDKRKFNSYEKLYEYINSMDQNKYYNYLETIKDFLRSEKAYPFSIDCFVRNLTKQIFS